MKERIFALEEEIKHKNLSQIFVNKLLFRRRFDVHTTSITLKRRHTDVKTTSCAYWENQDPPLHLKARWVLYLS